VAVLRFFDWLTQQQTTHLAAFALLVCAVGSFAAVALLHRRRRRRAATFARDMTAARRAEEHQQLLIAELDHRVKNVLARVAAVVQRTREGSPSTEAFAAALEAASS
jgi:cytochrome b